MPFELAFPEMTPREFLELIVRPNMEALRADPGSPRHAYNAVLTADALAAHVFVRLVQFRPLVVPKYPNHDDGYRGALADVHPPYRVLRDLALALKHAALLRKDGKGNPIPRIVRAAGQMAARPSGFDHAVFDVDVFDAQSLVVVHTDDGAVPRFVADVITEGLAVLEAELQKHDL